MDDKWSNDIILFFEFMFYTFCVIDDKNKGVENWTNKRLIR